MIPTAVLIGNPSVGKSLIFNQLTGLGVDVSNYPGTTVGLQKGHVHFGNSEFDLIDLPGIYSLSGHTPEESMVREYLVNENPDLIVVVLDAHHLERNLYLLLQASDIGKPLLVVLNMADEAKSSGIVIDTEKLTEIFGAPVIETVGTEGKNLDKIAEIILSGTVNAPNFVSRFEGHIEAAVHNLQKFHGISAAEALFALQGIRVGNVDEEIFETTSVLADEIEKHHVMSPEQIIAANHHNRAKEIAASVISEAPPKKRRDFDSLLTRVFPGIPILILIMAAILAFVFIVGGFLEEAITTLLETYLLEPFQSLNLYPLVENLGESVILAVISGLGIAFPYVFLFYIFISILEDTGYLTRAAFLADRLMHKMGLHGQGFIPLVLSFGCSVPAVMSVRLLPTKRERFIASILVTMLPCSARTVVISGVAASFIGFGAAFSIYGIVFLLVFVIGCLLSRITPGEQYGMILEMAEIRRPQVKYVVKKAWMRVKEFLFIAMPLILVSSVALGLCEYLGWVEIFESFIDPVSMAVLGLPGFAFTALLFGILRKEMVISALADLGGSVDFGSILSMPQLYIFVLVCVLFIPCISTIAVLIRETGVKRGLIVALFTVCLGLVCGALLHLIFGLF
ncbi:MAG TPA: ferrous iron transport protein B [Methanocorpusculum sp.]|nr:ferrous iron transport protein B [Methanocorpusculum sp.]